MLQTSIPGSQKHDTGIGKTRAQPEPVLDLPGASPNAQLTAKVFVSLSSVRTAPRGDDR